MSKPSPTPTQIGTSIAVKDSTELATLDASQMLPGTTVYNTGLGTSWILTVSTASLGPTVVAVSGITGYRWIEVDVAGGFVTLAELASTTVTSGATLIGVNANGGMFSEPDLQHVLQEDVTLKATLAATDGSGGGSLVGLQNVGNYYGSAHNVEVAIQAAGAVDTTQTANIATNTTNIASNTTAIGLRQTIAAPSAFALTTGQVLEVDLADAATNSVSNIRKSVHTSSGTAAAGFGNSETQTLPSSTGVARVATSVFHSWITATDASEDAAVTVQAMRGGTLATLARFNGKNASGNWPVEVSLANADGQSIGLTKAGDQEIAKTGSGVFYLRGITQISLATQNFQGVVLLEESSVVSTVFGRNVDLGNSSNAGFMYEPSSLTTGPQTVAPTGFNSGLRVAKTPTVWNDADKKHWGYFSTVGWLSTTFTTPRSIGASLTNNCTPSGTTNTIPDFTNGSVYATDYANLHAAVSQIALKLTNLELAVKLNTSMAIT